MQTLILPSHRKARVWIDDSPPARFDAQQNVEHVYAAAPASRVVESRRVAVELFIPKGAYAMYGLLGAELLPDESGKLYVSIKTSSSLGERYDNSLASIIDDVYVGLPYEYVPGMLQGVLSAQEQLGFLPSGQLRFDSAAHGAAGSSQAVFKELTGIIIKLLTSERLPADRQELIKFLTANLTL